MRPLRYWLSASRMYVVDGWIGATMALVSSSIQPSACAASVRGLKDPSMSGPPVQLVVDVQQDNADRGREHDDHERHRHDELDVVKADAVHEEVAEPALRGEHLREQRPDQREREADAQAREDLGD